MNELDLFILLFAEQGARGQIIMSTREHKSG
jgi:hypothetical protein